MASSREPAPKGGAVARSAYHVTRWSVPPANRPSTSGRDHVAEVSNREIVERFARAIEAKDFEAQAALTADDYVEEMPQSGERIRGRTNHQAIVRSYPGGVGTAASGKVVGSEDQWLVGPAFNVLRVMGSGDTYTYVATVQYPNGEVWHMIAMVKVRDGKIARSTTWYAAPFDAPDWRAPYVERFKPMSLADLEGDSA
jgi:ketosteroid isomerase-like protein